MPEKRPNRDQVLPGGSPRIAGNPNNPYIFLLPRSSPIDWDHKKPWFPMPEKNETARKSSPARKPGWEPVNRVPNIKQGAKLE